MGYIDSLRQKIGHDPIIMPSASLIIYKEGQILLQKRTDDGCWAIHGGAMEIGETMIETLIREVKEEIGIIPITYQLYGIYSGPNTHHIYPNLDEIYGLNIVYFCTSFKGKLKIDNQEVEALKWFPIDKLPDNISNNYQWILKDLKEYLKTVANLEK